MLPLRSPAGPALQHHQLLPNPEISALQLICSSISSNEPRLCSATRSSETWLSKGNSLSPPRYLLTLPAHPAPLQFPALLALQAPLLMGHSSISYPLPTGTSQKYPPRYPLQTLPFFHRSAERNERFFCASSLQKSSFSLP